MKMSIFLLWFKFDNNLIREGSVVRNVIRQVQAIEMYSAAQPNFLKSEINGGIKNIISHHLKIIKRCIFSPNLEGVAQKISLPRP